jgi:hypothetical protein
LGSYLSKHGKSLVVTALEQGWLLMFDEMCLSLKFVYTRILVF